MKAILLAAALALAAAPAMVETTWSGTGPRSGTVQGSGSCAHGNGALTCDRASTLANPYGKSATRTGKRVTTAAGTTMTFVTTGPNGHSTTSTRSRTR